MAMWLGLRASTLTAASVASPCAGGSAVRATTAPSACADATAKHTRTTSRTAPHIPMPAGTQDHAETGGLPLPRIAHRRRHSYRRLAREAVAGAGNDDERGGVRQAGDEALAEGAEL